jgi:hypothetical protein
VFHQEGIEGVVDFVLFFALRHNNKKRPDTSLCTQCTETFRQKKPGTKDVPGPVCYTTP